MCALCPVSPGFTVEETRSTQLPRGRDKHGEQSQSTGFLLILDQLTRSFESRLEIYDVFSTSRTTNTTSASSGNRLRGPRIGWLSPPPCQEQASDRPRATTRRR
ncbi:hypothetical protein CLAIMM_08215 [Cladophialophora immunda]|nr:hypothetical protein CLAIMM_08215 [Cladophialophora immunda]